MLTIRKNRLTAFIISLCLITVISWMPILLVPFINDDFQILGFHLNKNFLTAFEPFWQKDISQFYWRPLGNLLHPFMLIIFGFNALPFRILSLFLNILCGITLYKLLSKLEINESVAKFASILFCLLPSHEFQYTWIADQGEILLAILLMFSFYNYAFLYLKNEDKKYLVLSVILFLAASLVKETAYIGIFIPLLGLLNSDKINKKLLMRTLYNSFSFIFIIVVLMLYRVLVIGSSPLESNHFASLNPVTMALNFVTYFLLVFFPPEALEWVRFNVKNLLVTIPIVTLLLLLLFFFVSVIFNLPTKKKKVFFIGIAWFIIFILPAVPVLMRWYGFTASIGIIVSISVIAEAIDEKTKLRRFLLILSIAVFVLLCFINFCKMLDYKIAGTKLNTTLNLFGNEKTKTQIYIWAVPDKYNRVPMMKLGVRETVQWALKKNDLLVFAPLRVELIGNEPSIKLISSSANELQFDAINCRFMKEGGKSKYIFENENEKYTYEGNLYEITTYRKENVVYSKVKIHLIKLPDSDFDQFYFNGEKFIRFEIKK